MLATEAFKDSDNDRLPVVELRPFVKKEWRPSKSLPDSDMERRNLGTAKSTMSSRSLDFESAGYPNPEKQMTITPRVHDGLCPKSFLAHNERRSQHPPLREPREVYVEYDTWRGRERFMDHPEGFVSKIEREKSTVEEVKTGSTICTQYSCLKRALTEVDLRNQQAMRISGKKMENLPQRGNSVYGDINEYYRLTKSYTMGASVPKQSDEDKENKRKNDQMHDMRSRMDGIQTAYLDDTIYDAFDRSSTLPSIRVKKAGMKKRKVVSQYPPGSEGSSRKSSGRKSRGPPAYRLGVTNSLHLMSHIGKPVSVEHKLSHELRITLSSLRRNKDSGSIISGAYKIIPRYDATPTIGESRINSEMRPTVSRFGQESRQNTQSNRNQYMSRASTYMRSENLDSGIESTGGCRSPIKPMSRNVSSRLYSKKHNGKETPVTANIPTDTKGYTSSEVSKNSTKDIDALFNRGVNGQSIMDDDRKQKESIKTPHIATIPTDIQSTHDDPTPQNLEDVRDGDEPVQTDQALVDDQNAQETLDADEKNQEISSIVDSKENTPRVEPEETTTNILTDDGQKPTESDVAEDSKDDNLPTERGGKRTFVTQQPSRETFDSNRDEKEESPREPDPGACESVEVPEDEQQATEEEEEEEPEVGTLLPNYTV